MSFFNSKKSILPHSECNTSQTTQEIQSLEQFICFLETSDTNQDMFNIIMSFIALTEYNNLSLINRRWNTLINQIIIPENIYHILANLLTTLPDINQQKKSLIPVLSNRTSKDTLQGHTFKELKNRIEEINQSQVLQENQFNNLYSLSDFQNDCFRRLFALKVILAILAIPLFMASFVGALISVALLIGAGTSAAITTSFVLTDIGMASVLLCFALSFTSSKLADRLYNFSKQNKKTYLILKDNIQSSQFALTDIKKRIRSNFFTSNTENKSDNPQLPNEKSEASSLDDLEEYNLGLSQQ